MSFNTSTPAPQTQPVPIQPEGLATNQQNVPVPVWWGRRKIAARWITGVKSQIAVQAKGPSSKKNTDSKGGGGSGFTAYDYYGDIAAVIRCGPVDGLSQLIVNGVIIWNGPIYRTDMGVGNPYTLTITDSSYLLDGGYVKFYWGGQTSWDANFPGHPSYKDFATIVFHKFHFGTGTTTAPNIEIIAEAIPRPPSSVISATALDSSGQANLWAVLAELLTTLPGAALDPSKLDAASWQAAHDFFAIDSDHKLLTYCSPLLTDQAAAGAFISQLTSLCDGWMRMKLDGTIEAGYYPVDPGDLSAYTTLDANDLVEEPQLLPDSWDNVPTGIVVSFADGDQWYFTNCVKADSLVALHQAVEPRRESLQLENYIVVGLQAQKLANEWVKRKCQPQIAGTIKVRAESAVNPGGSPLRVGDRFLLDIDPEPGGAGLAQLCRVNERRRSPTGPVTLVIEAEVNQPAVPFTATYTPPAAGNDDVAAIASARIVPMPLSLSNGDPAIGVLAQRGDGTTVGAHVLFDVDGGIGTFTTLGQQVGFAVPCQLAADYADDATSDIEVTILDTRDQALALQQPGSSGAQNDELILAVYKTDGSNYIDENADGSPKLEWFSIQASALVSGNTYNFTALRARLGTMAQGWNIGDLAWIIPRANFASFTHVNFAGYVAGLDDLVFRLSPYSKYLEYSGVPANLPFHFPTAWSRIPEITWSAPASFAFTLASGGDLTPAATITDNDGNTVRITLYYVRDDTGIQTTVFDVYLPPSGSVILADCFTRANVATPVNFPGQVSIDTFYTLTIRAQDAKGNVVESRRSLMRAATGGGGPGLNPPTFSPESQHFSSSINIVLLAVSPATEIQYSATAVGAWAPGTIVTKPLIHFGVQLTSASRLWARSGDGVNWSAWAFMDYRKP